MSPSHDEYSPIEVEEDEGSDQDSMFSSTMALTSNITKYPIEYGRRYHAYKHGIYSRPNDETELDRLDLMHAMISLMHDGKLHLAPIGKSPRLCLDIGAGSGIWCIDFADQYPSTEVIGVDLSPTLPSMVPPNLRFEIWDVEDEWGFPHKFDYIHSRYMAGSIEDWPGFMKNCFNGVRPGGWVEFQDFNVDYYSQDDSSQRDTALRRWLILGQEAEELTGRTLRPGRSLEAWAREAGFVNISVVKTPVPIGTWPKDPKLKQIGLFNWTQLYENLQGFSNRIFLNYLGWSKPELELLLVDVRKDLKDRSLHLLYDFNHMRVWCPPRFERAPLENLKGAEAAKPDQTMADRSAAESLIPRFRVEKLLNQDQNDRRISILGSIDEQPGILVVERAAFVADLDSLKAFHGALSNVVNLGANDIYRWYMASSGQNHVNPPDLKLNLIWPCTEQHILKYSAQNVRMVTETPDVYQKHVRPYMQEKRGNGRLNWVYNIIEGRKEQEDVLYRESDPEEGFLLLPDLNWDRKTIGTLRLLALVERRDIWSLRDLKKSHVAWLTHMRRKLLDAVAKVYPELEADQLKLYVHYHPTYYHFHIHVVNVMLEAGTTQSTGKAFGLENLISQLETMAGGPDASMADVSLSFFLGESSELWAKIFGPLKQGITPNSGDPHPRSFKMAENPDCPSNAKAFVPLENNPEVMSHLVHQLGLPRSLGFTDVYSIDEPDLLAFVPRPSHALLLVFPVSPAYESARMAEDSSKPDYTGSGPTEPITWFKQTIRNACGLIGLLHAVSNGEPRKHVTPGSDLETLLRQAEPLDPIRRADLLYESSALESAHADAAKRGDTTAPDAEANVDLHFVCFVKGDDGRLWELDGRRKGPLDRGVLEEGEDMLSEKALDAGVRRFLKAEAAGGAGDLRFSLVSLGPLFD
ncbi:conserved hypothetical protein [Uncinocarpus reesii 1704]|uniref:ubiquitinyl hydrolase 1 n=1 Tax=Uncinocarpus reesii (strain UAMH 1704) TaxID=336963 RepID=C4JEC2_UNCRE|nr:uncharacterized protein UREG_00738 [Uncinocarpus reesii 1704]EEP75891.1 conserved hypothetical protein [Uncinocarpus reesii 1704]